MPEVELLDCVATYHTNAVRCGIAKFNRDLARKLDVPLLQVFADEILDHSEPLISVRLGEFSSADAAKLGQLIERMGPRRFSVFLHGFGDTPVERKLVSEAATVYCGNTEMALRVRAQRADVVEAWCPGTIDRAQEFTPSDISVFTFGMAHKVRASSYRKLQTLLERTGQTYSLFVSTALHEGTSFDDEFEQAFQQMRTIFRGRAYFLGYLSDAAVYERLVNSTFFAAFFDPGVRSNNTSVNSALAAGCAVITNLDDLSPSYLRHMETVIDVNAAVALPTEEVLSEIRSRAQDVGRGSLGWERLIRLINVGSGIAPANGAGPRTGRMRGNRRAEIDVGHKRT